MMQVGSSGSHPRSRLERKVLRKSNIEAAGLEIKPDRVNQRESIKKGVEPQRPKILPVKKPATLLVGTKFIRVTGCLITTSSNNRLSKVGHVIKSILVQTVLALAESPTVAIQ